MHPLALSKLRDEAETKGLELKSPMGTPGLEPPSATPRAPRNRKLELREEPGLESRHSDVSCVPDTCQFPEGTCEAPGLGHFLIYSFSRTCHCTFKFLSSLMMARHHRVGLTMLSQVSIQVLFSGLSSHSFNPLSKRGRNSWSQGCACCPGLPLPFPVLAS